MKKIFRDWSPPVLFRLVRQYRYKGIRFEGPFDTWSEAAAKCTGYNDGEILNKVLAATLKVKRGEAAYERDSVLFDVVEYDWPVLTGLMWAAARNNGKLNVLDFGGALGSSYFQNRKALQTIPSVHWNVIEQPHYVDAGRLNLQDDKLRFYMNMDECLKHNSPNVILLSSVLQYLEYPIEIINDISVLKADILIINRTPFSSLDYDDLLVQLVPESIYSGSYPMWVLSYSKVIASLKNEWVLFSRFSSLENVISVDKKDFGSFEGLLFERIK